jgi:hypothetical protein
MAFTTIDPATPAGADKKKFGDDKIREFKSQVIANLQVISNYPASTMPAFKTAVWTTATRPAGTELIDKISGYNTDLGYEEYYDSITSKWKPKGRALDAWTVAGRPTSPFTGQYGFNTELAVIERYSGSTWVRVSGGRRGDIKMWSGSASDIETGWCLADGVLRNHPEGGSFTPPNLRDRFILGAGSSYSVGATGGETTHTLTINEMPAHTHTGNYPDTQDSYHPAGSQPYGARNFGTHETSSVGGGAAHNNMPPYYALCFLYKL